MEKLNKKVLIVEDEDNFFLPLQKVFSDAGFDVASAKNGEEGLAVAEKEKPDIIILDILLPTETDGIDGIEVAKKLKESGNTAPIIFLTNLKDATHIASAMELGRHDSDYIVKSEMSLEDIVNRAKTKLGIK